MPRGTAGVLARASKEEFMTDFVAFLESEGYSINNYYTGDVIVSTIEKNYTVDRDTALTMLVEGTADVTFWHGDTWLPIMLTDLEDGYVMAAVAIDGYDEDQQFALYSRLLSGMEAGGTMISGFYIDRSDILDLISERIPVDLAALAGDESVFREFYIATLGFKTEIVDDVRTVIGNPNGFILVRADTGVPVTYFMT